MNNPPDVPDRDRSTPPVLTAHLRSWVGAWPPDGALAVVGNPRNDEPAWDGEIRPVVGVVDAEDNAVVGIPPAYVDAVHTAHLADLPDLEARLPALLELADHRMFRGVMRWTLQPSDLPDAGIWLDVSDPRVPAWLHPFGGEVLVALDDDRYVAGVGIKRHDRFGRELAVVTDEAARGRGLARRLVAQAARRVVDEGFVATYLHAPNNAASARVADSAGLPDRGWSILGMFRADPGGT